MNNTIKLSALLLLIGASAFAQDSTAPERPKFTKSQAELLVPRPLLKPVPSMMPNSGAAIDTLETGNPLVRIVLYNDNTWRYIKNGNLLNNNEFFTSHWNNSSMDPFGVEYGDLPERVTLWLVDNATTDFCCPNKPIMRKPFPASPACAASIDALKDRSCVCDAIDWIELTNSLIFLICPLTSLKRPERRTPFCSSSLTRPLKASNCAAV